MSQQTVLGEATDVARPPEHARATRAEIDPANPSGSLAPAMARIAEMAALPPDWDADGAEPLTAVAVARACLLMTMAAEMRRDQSGRCTVPLTSSPLPDGGIQVEWLGPAARIDVEIAPDGTFDYMIKRLDGKLPKYEVMHDVHLESVLDRIDDIVSG